MVPGTGGYGTVIPFFHEGLWGKPLVVVHHTTQGMHQETYIIMLCLSRNKKYAAG